MKCMDRIGIHLRILAAAVLLISAATSVLGYLGASMIRDFVEARFEERIAFLGKYLALNSELGLLIDERPMLRRIAENLLVEKDVVRVTILNREGEVLADAVGNIPDDFSEVQLPVTIREPHEESLAFQWREEAALAEERIGTVRIAYGAEGIRELLLAMQKRFAWLSVCLAGICALFFFFISRSLVAPVSRLAEAARKVAGGDRGLRVSPAALPEARELAVAFNAMLDSLESNREALEEAHRKMVRQETLAELGKFSLMIAHEVKNPLGIIKSSVDVLRNDVESDSGHVMVGYIEDEVRRLNRLIEDFLLFARPAMPSFRETDLNAMLREIVDRFDIQLNGLAASVEADIPKLPLMVSADPDLLGRAIQNILKNAMDANGGRGTVRIRARADAEEWIVAVEDDGPGVDAGNRSRIFEPFFTTRAKGTGLGLAFAHQVAAAHSGRIVCEEGETGGARFRIILPTGNDQQGART